MNQLLNWLTEYQLLISVLSGVSVLLVALTVLATPWLIARLPDDYLLNYPLERKPQHILDWLISTLRCILGACLATLGLIMMITPGPGLVVIIIGISIARFPGKQRLLVNLVTRPSVFSSLNWMRRRYDKPPFLAPRTTLR